MKNNNGSSIRRLSKRSLKNNHMRNLFVILAIALTGTLFTAAFSLTSGAMYAAQENTMREVGTKSHAGLKAATKEQCEKITADPMVKKSNYNILIGVAENIRKRSAEIRYIPDKEALDDWMISLEEGSLPTRKNEIIVDSFIMDELNLPHKTGGKVPLQFTFMGQKVEEEFVISGWYEGDYIAHASELFLSDRYWQELKGALTDADFQKWQEEHPADSGVGLRAVNLTFENSSNIQEKVQTVIRNAGYEPGTEIEYGVNWAYMQNRLDSADPMTIILLASVILITLVTGYLIIYNIFQISIIGDIRFYGLLKTIGTTKRQIHKLINRQALMLSVIGIPIGLVLGCGLGSLILPFALQSFSQTITSSARFFDPWVLPFGAAFSALTVFLSCRKPGRIAGNISPVEAVKYTENTGMKKKGRKTKRAKTIQNSGKAITIKPTGRFKPFTMALASLGRNKQTTSVVTATISLSIILLAIVTTIADSFSLDKFFEQRIAGDFLLENISLTSSSRGMGGININPDYLALADSQSGITNRNEMYVDYGTSIPVNDKAAERYRTLEAEGKLSHRQYGTENLEDLQSGKASIQGYTYAYDMELLSSLKAVEGTIDPEKFQDGGYILLGTLNGNDTIAAADHVYYPGDKITFQYISENSTFREITDESGQTTGVIWENLGQREYEVMAIVEIPPSMCLQRYTPNACDSIIPLSDLAERKELFAVSYQVNDDCQNAFENAIKNFSETVDMEMGYLSKNSLREEFNGMISTISIIGIALAAVIALIGILNFINATVTEIVSRKHEFAMLQSIGMTNSQLLKILVYEGFCYIGIAGIVSFVIGSLLSWKILDALNNVLLFFDYHFQIIPFFIMMPLLILIAALTPMLSYRNMKKKSIVERLRETE